MDETREAAVMSTFAALADTLVDDYDVVELLQTLVDACRDILGHTAAGILLADESGQVELIASTSEASREVELMQIAAASGPCIECFHTGRRISVPSIAEAPARWSGFSERALTLGFAAVEAIPLRLRDLTIGTLNLLNASAGEPPASDIVTTQAFADVATIGILHERTLKQTEVLASQLRHALQSRVTIEQAKGVVSFTAGAPIDEAFTLIRRYARNHQMQLSTLATRIVRREITITGAADAG